MHMCNVKQIPVIYELKPSTKETQVKPFMLVASFKDYERHMFIRKIEKEKNHILLWIQVYNEPVNEAPLSYMR